MNLLSIPPANYHRHPILGLIQQQWVETTMESVHPMWSLQKIRAKVLMKRAVSSEVVELTLQPNRNWLVHIPGQFVPLRIMINGRIHERCYSIISDPKEVGAIRIAVKRIDNGLVSAHIHDELQVGDVIELGPANGECTFNAIEPLGNRAKILLWAGGVGITPVLGLLHEVIEKGLDCIVLYSTGERNMSLYVDDIVRAYQSATCSIHIQTHKFHEYEVETIVPDLDERTWFVCGPSGLMDSAADLHRQREGQGRIFTERFASPEVIGLNEAEATVNFSRSSLTATTTSTILDTALASGIQPHYGCRMGICNSCRCHKTSGIVRNIRTNELSGNGPEEIRACISQPVGDVSVRL